MAFKLENFGSEVANAKSIIGGIAYYRYHNAEGDEITAAGYFPKNLGLKLGDRICVIPDDPQVSADTWYGVSAVASDGTITVAALL